MKPHYRPLQIVLTILSFCAYAHAQTTRPVPQIQRIMVISIDGLRPDVLLRAKTPTLHQMMDSGSFSLWAQTVPVAITLPSHVSMLTGVSVQKHGITFNDERATTRPFYPRVATLFEVAKAAGYSTAIVAGKSKFAVFNKPGAIDWYSAPEDPKTTDATVADMAGATIRLHKPQVMFVHFPGADTAGHAKGWDSPEQLAAVEGIDKGVEVILNALKQSGLDESTAIIVSADHGGSGKTHGANDLRSIHIPWICVGPGIRKNFDLTFYRDLTVHTEDTFATACYLMGIDPGRVDGKPVKQMISGYELLQPTTTPAKETPLVE